MANNEDVIDLMREVERLKEALAAAEARPSVENCMQERAEGNGGCGACALCCKEQRERAEAAEQARDAALRERDEAKAQAFSGHDWNRILNERDAALQRAEALAKLVGLALVLPCIDPNQGEAPAEEPQHALTITVWDLVKDRAKLRRVEHAVRLSDGTPEHESVVPAAVRAALSSTPDKKEPTL